MPSVADLVFVAIVVALLFTPLVLRLLGDAGAGWHIRVGQIIAATHSIPRLDPFSSIMQGKPWFAWEWLYDVGVAYLDSRFGLNGVVWFTALMIAATFASLFRLLIRRGVNIAVTLLLTLLAVSSSTIHFLARPHVISWLLVLVWYWILSSADREPTHARRLYFLPVLMVFWVNLHGGFVLGFILLFLFWVGALWEWYSSDQEMWNSSESQFAGLRLRHFTYVGALSLAASLINPYGWALHRHVYSYLTNRFLMDHIDEFQSPNFHGIAQRCFLLLMLIVFGAVVVHGRRLRISKILTLLFAVYSALYASRGIPTSAILLCVIGGPMLRRFSLPDLPGSSRRQTFVQRMTAIELHQRGHMWAILAVIVTAAICFQGGKLGDHSLVDAHFDANRMPVKAVDFLIQNATVGPIFAPDYWGGYLIYRLYPKMLVVVDDRHDLYGSKLLESYLTTIHGELGWPQFLREHHPTYLVLPRKIALTGAISESPDWKLVYKDDTACVFVPSAFHNESQR